MTSPRLARPTRVVRDHVEWYRHARMGATIRALGKTWPGRPRSMGKALRRWYMLGRTFA
jgi:hypothetical protein